MTAGRAGPAKSAQLPPGTKVLMADGTTARPVRHWLEDEDESERALLRLAAGNVYAYPIPDSEGVRYVLSAYPPRHPRPGKPISGPAVVPGALGQESLGTM